MKKGLLITAVAVALAVGIEIGSGVKTPDILTRKAVAASQELPKIGAEMTKYQAYSNRVYRFEFSDGLRCAVIHGGYGPSGVSCNWSAVK